MQPDLFDLGRLQDMLDVVRVVSEYLAGKTMEQLVSDRILPPPPADPLPETTEG